jgi:hypothetical protein
MRFRAGDLGHAPPSPEDPYRKKEEEVFVFFFFLLRIILEEEKLNKTIVDFVLQRT